MARWKGAFAITALVLCPLRASTEPLVLKLSPDKTSLTFTVKATGHAIEGLLALDSGEIRFDPDTGTASGQVTIDLRRAGTGNRLRDREMHASVLETERYPVATFRPSGSSDPSRRPARPSWCSRDCSSCTGSEPPSAFPSEPGSPAIPSPPRPRSRCPTSPGGCATRASSSFASRPSPRSACGPKPASAPKRGPDEAPRWRAPPSRRLSGPVRGRRPHKRTSSSLAAAPRASRRPSPRGSMASG